jgi:hypothetical protein
MSRRSRRAASLALAGSAPLALAVAAARASGDEDLAHAAGALAVVLGLPWIVPAMIVVAVLSAPLYVALHWLGYPQALGPWLAAVILIAAVIGWHVNLALAIARRLQPRTRSERGLADFLRRTH